MFQHLPIILLGSAMVALRALRQRVLRSTIHALSRGEKPKLFGVETLEVKGKAEDLPATTPTLKTASTLSTLLVRLEATDKGAGKLPVFELTTGWRRVRWLLSAKARGPLLDVTIVPSPAGLFNLATVLLLVGVIALIFNPGWIFASGMAILLAVDAWFRMRIPTDSVKAKLEKMLAVEG